MIVIAPTILQLGNQLNLLAHCLGYGFEYGHTIVYPEFRCYAASFTNTLDNYACCFPKSSIANRIALLWPSFMCRLSSRLGRIGKSLVSRKGISKFTYLESNDEFNRCILDDEQFCRLRDPHQMIALVGYEFRTRHCRNKHAEGIISTLAPCDIFKQAAAKVVARARSTCDVLIGVHIRHGDYKTFKGGAYYFESVTYLQWMREMISKLPGRRVAFLVCSNNPDPLPFSAELTIHFGPGDAPADLSALSQCDYIIGPPSSFSGWAAFQGDVPIQFLESADVRAPELADFTPGRLLNY